MALSVKDITNLQSLYYKSKFKNKQTKKKTRL